MLASGPRYHMRRLRETAKPHWSTPMRSRHQRPPRARSFGRSRGLTDEREVDSGAGSRRNDQCPRSRRDSPVITEAPGCAALDRSLTARGHGGISPAPASSPRAPRWHAMTLFEEALPARGEPDLRCPVRAVVSGRCMGPGRLLTHSGLGDAHTGPSPVDRGRPRQQAPLDHRPPRNKAWAWWDEAAGRVRARDIRAVVTASTKTQPLERQRSCSPTGWGGLLRSPGAGGRRPWRPPARDDSHRRTSPGR